VSAQRMYTFNAATEAKQSTLGARAALPDRKSIWLYWEDYYCFKKCQGGDTAAQ